MCIFLPPFNNYYIHVKNGVFVVLVLRMYSILGEIVWFKEGKKWSCMHHVLLMDDFFFNYLTNGAHFMKDGIFLLPFCPLHQTGLVHYLTISVLHNLLFFLYNLCLVLWGLKTSLIYFSKWVFFFSSNIAAVGCNRVIGWKYTNTITYFCKRGVIFMR